MTIITANPRCLIFSDQARLAYSASVDRKECKQVPKRVPEEVGMLAEMKVSDLMTRDVISVMPDAKLNAAQEIMEEYGIRHLPVVEHGRLVGIISKGDIREAKPSDATTLSVWEVNYLWDTIHVRQVMTTTVLTVDADQPLVDALKLMVARKFSSLPVVREEMLVGILTETDIFNKIIALAERELQATRP